MSEHEISGHHQMRKADPEYVLDLAEIENSIARRDRTHWPVYFQEIVPAMFGEIQRQQGLLNAEWLPAQQVPEDKGRPCWVAVRAQPAPNYVGHTNFYTRPPVYNPAEHVAHDYYTDGGWNFSANDRVVAWRYKEQQPPFPSHLLTGHKSE